jgi:hypothetical protein
MLLISVEFFGLTSKRESKGSGEDAKSRPKALICYRKSDITSENQNTEFFKCEFF